MLQSRFQSRQNSSVLLLISGFPKAVLSGTEISSMNYLPEKKFNFNCLTQSPFRHSGSEDRCLRNTSLPLLCKKKIRRHFFFFVHLLKYNRFPGFKQSRTSESTVHCTAFELEYKCGGEDRTIATSLLIVPHCYQPSLDFGQIIVAMLHFTWV